MLRNVESRFAEVPQIDIERSVLDMSHGHTTSFDAGLAIPFFRMQVLPGDTVDLSTSIVARLQTLLTPIFSNVYIDTMYFFVPYRICWNHWKEFLGENSAGPWAQQVSYTVPKISSPTNGWNVGTVADYLGVPPGVEFNSTNGLMPNVLDFRAYALCCQEWLRDQNLTDPLNIPLGDSNQIGSNGSNYINDVVNGGVPFKAAKYHDYFTSCLPDPQKTRTPVSFPLISGAQAPVYADATAHRHDTVQMYLINPANRDGPYTGKYPLNANFGYSPGRASGHLSGYYDDSLVNAFALGPSNLYADLSTTVGSVTINQLRLAFQMQKFYEKQARGGSRYREQIKSMFGVNVPDARMMIPEYLGGHRFPLQIHQIANTSESSTSKLGDLGAMSNTTDVNDDFIKSFSEHGVVLGIMVARYDHVYCQGLHRDFTRENYFDFYWPVFANIGEQPVYKYEIDATVRANEDRKAVFGYNEAWASYRYMPNRLSGEMRPQVQNNFASWHLGDNYSAMPSLSDGWIREDKSNIDRVLAVTSANANQILADIWFDLKVTRPMPVFSVPGLIDHH